MKDDIFLCCNHLADLLSIQAGHVSSFYPAKIWQAEGSIAGHRNTSGMHG
jgi:hypothetical protein